MKDLTEQIIEIDGRTQIKMRQMTVIAVRNEGATLSLPYANTRLLVDVDRGDGNAILGVVCADGVYPAVGEGVWVMSMGKGRWLCTSSVGRQYGVQNNILDNGDFRVAQREYGLKNQNYVLASGFDSFSAQRGADRWNHINSNLGTVLIHPSNMSQSLPGGSSQRIQPATAVVSPGAGDYYIWRQSVEWMNTIGLNWGYPNAQPVTLSFWVYSNHAATYIVELEQVGGVARRISRSYTVQVGYQKISLTFPGDSGSATWDGASSQDINYSFLVTFWMMSGSTYNSGALATVWTTAGTGSRAAGCSNFMASTANFMQFMQVKLEAGTAATPIITTNYADEFSKCVRFYRRLHSYGSDGYQALLPGIMGNTSGTAYTVYVPHISMRGTIGISSGGNLRMTDEATGYPLTGLAAGVHNNGGNACYFYLLASGGSGGNKSSMILGQNGDHTAFIAFSAE